MHSADEIMYSSNEQFDELVDKDKAVEIIGYVDELNAPTEVGKTTKYSLFKFVLNNNSGRRITCLVWRELVAKYKDEVTINRILHIDGGHCKAISNNYYKESSNLEKFEIIIQASTKVHYKGYHRAAISDSTLSPPVPKVVSFENIRESNGLIRIVGYIKTNFTVAQNFNRTMTYGIGSITDGIYKINIQVATFECSNYEKGEKIVVTGTVDETDEGPITVFCSDMNCIELAEDLETMTEAQVLRGCKTPAKRARLE